MRHLKFAFLILATFGMNSCAKLDLGKGLAGYETIEGGNALGFQKSPVYTAQKGIAYSLAAVGNRFVVSPSVRIDFDNYLIPITIEGTQNGLLENGDFKVYPDLGGKLRRAHPNKLGYWLFSSADDPDKKLGQVMAFYWLNEQAKYAESQKPGLWAAKGKEIEVFSQCEDPLAQSAAAFWDPSLNRICMGSFDNLDTAYDASIYVHEAQHANIGYATKGQVYATSGAPTTELCYAGDPNTTPSCCKASVPGCMPAMDEGMADYFAYTLFESPTLAEFFMNTPTGFAERNADLNLKSPIITLQSMNDGTRIDPNRGVPFGSANGREIHNMGGVWGTALWNLRKTLGKSVADKIFLSNLHNYTGNDTFSTALSNIILTDRLLYPSNNHETQIRNVFGQHGITAP